ncbi:MAG: hypothetical protein GEU99_21175 [Luteitalea sp.]|nr:hypothetical protein [Luteitalea sp.]
MPVVTTFRRVFWIQTAGRAATLLLLVSAPLYGQANTAAIHGDVIDPSKAVIAKAQIEARNDLTGVSTFAETNAAGQFTLPFLPIGTYTVSAYAAGFETQAIRNVTLSAGDRVNLKFQLALSTMQESVTVSQEAPLLNAVGPEQHLTIGTVSVRELPLARQDWTSLLRIGNGISSPSDGVVLNGLGPELFNLTVDGTSASGNPERPSLGAYQSFNVINQINTEAIAEISTTKGIAPASVNSMSGNVNLITKSGTNEFHGSLIEFNSLSAYNARNALLTSEPDSTTNQFGGSLGGPIARDKLFFFGSYQGVRISSFAPISGTVPTPEFASDVTAVAPVYSPLFALVPAPNRPYAAGAQMGEYIGSGALRQNDNNGSGRIDYYLSSQNSLTLRYSRSRPYREQPALLAINPRLTSGRNDSYNAQFMHSGRTWTSTSRFGYNRTDLLRRDAGMDVDLPRIQFGGFNPGGAESFEIVGGAHTWEQMIAKQLGRHSLQFGGIIQRWNAGRVNTNLPAYQYSELSDFLANIPSRINVRFVRPLYKLTMMQMGAFVQDDIRLKPGFTLNLGVRYDYFTVPEERDGRLFSRLPSELGPGFGDFADPSHLYDANRWNFAPRIGFAWQVGKTVLRGGAGVFYAPHILYQMVSFVLPASNVPDQARFNRAQALARGLRYPVDAAAIEAEVLASSASGASFPNSSISQHFPNPYTTQATLTIERDLGWGTVFEIGYVGNRAGHLMINRVQNRPDRQTGIAPRPDWSTFDYYDTSDSSWYNGLQTSLRKRFDGGLSFGIHYTYASNMSYGDASLTPYEPQDNDNIRAERGPTPFDIRHSFNTNVLYEIAAARWLGIENRAAKVALDGWQVSGILTATTGRPVNITDGRSTYGRSRPDAVAGVNPYHDDYRETRQYLDKSAFSQVPIVQLSGAAARPGNLGRNAVRASGQWTLDASLAKNLDITERFRLQLRVDAFNALNHTNLGGLVTDISNSNFGRLMSAAPSRSMQIGVKLMF